jgi:hypothetical protein
MVEANISQRALTASLNLLNSIILPPALASFSLRSKDSGSRFRRRKYRGRAMLYPKNTAVVLIREWYLHIGMVEGLADSSLFYDLSVLILIV